MKPRTAASIIAVITLAFLLATPNSYAGDPYWELPQSRRLEIGSKIMIRFEHNSLKRVWVAPPREAKVFNLMDPVFKLAYEQSGALCNHQAPHDPKKRRIAAPHLSAIDPASAAGRGITFRIDKYEDVRMKVGGVQTWIAVTQVDGMCHGWIPGNMISSAPGQNNYIIVK